MNCIYNLPFLAICLSFFGCTQTPKVITNLSTPSKINYHSPVLRIKNLESIFLGLDRGKVKAIMGTPEGKSTNPRKGTLWDYRRPVLDESTGKIYDWSLVTITFNKTGCTSVEVILGEYPKTLE